jgi:hypothetical protein
MRNAPRIFAFKKAQEDPGRRPVFIEKLLLRHDTVKEMKPNGVGKRWLS